MRARPAAAAAKAVEAAFSSAVVAGLSVETAAASAARAAELAVESAVGGRPWLSLFFSFVLGGFFFSSALGVFEQLSRMGLANARLATATAALASRRVLAIAKVSIVEAWRLARGRATGWREVRASLVEGWRSARRAAIEGLEAVRLERSVIASELGLPGLAFLQYSLDRWFPRGGAGAMEKALREALKDVQIPSRVSRGELVSFELGAVFPQLTSARLYDLGPDCIAFDVDVRWLSELRFDCKLVTPGYLGAKLPLSIRNVQFDGQLRLVLAPLTDDAPGFGATLLSLAQPPKIGLDIKLAGGELTKLPWLKTEIVGAIQAAIADTLLWPKRIVLPANKEDTNSPLLSPSVLQALLLDDPLLSAQKALAKSSTLLEELQRRNNATVSALDITFGEPTQPQQP